MHRRHFLTATAASLGVAALPGTALAAPIPLNELSRYLNALKSAQADFTQINGDGTISTGRLYIQRPGRARFEYAKEQTLVMAGGGQVAIFDGGSNMTRPETYPLAQTPLHIILERNVDLARRNMVVGHRSDGPKTTVTAQDPEHPEIGNIQLVFTGNPTELRQWIITDKAGQKTTVVLGDMQTGVSLGASLFNIPNEIAKRGG